MIVALLAEFSVSNSAARAALSRLTRNGLLSDVADPGGGRSSRLDSRAADVLDDGGRQIFSFGAVAAHWDGKGSWSRFSIPEDHRAVRD